MICSSIQDPAYYSSTSRIDLQPSTTLLLRAVPSPGTIFRQTAHGANKPRQAFRHQTLTDAWREGGPKRDRVPRFPHPLPPTCTNSNSDRNACSQLRPHFRASTDPQYYLPKCVSLRAIGISREEEEFDTVLPDHGLYYHGRRRLQDCLSCGQSAVSIRKFGCVVSQNEKSQPKRSRENISLE